MELGAELSTGFIGGMALWLKYSTTCLGTSARTHLARAAGDACKKRALTKTLTIVEIENNYSKLRSNKGMRKVQLVIGFLWGGAKRQAAERVFTWF